MVLLLCSNIVEYLLNIFIFIFVASTYNKIRINLKQSLKAFAKC